LAFSLLDGGDMKTPLVGLACVLAAAACSQDSGRTGVDGGPCVDAVQCIQGAHWDPNKCTCVLSGDGGGCVQTVQCTALAHWDPVACACVLDQSDGGAGDMGCVDNIQCSDGAHWDSVQCKCVFDGDMASGCSASCAGGGTGCPSMCSSCNAGELCCAWAGGVCIPNDMGTCSGSGGFMCAKATAAGVCPDQCFP
jgi:hypothetical protein